MESATVRRPPPLPGLIQLGLIGLLLVLAVLAWKLTDVQMAGMDAGPGTDLGSLGFFIGTWVVMMAAMMFPSIAPMVLMFSRIQAGRRERGDAVAGGLATLFVGVRSLSIPAIAWNRGGPYLAGAVLVAAAGYQLTPAKDACLRRCRGTLDFLMTQWRDGSPGALRMGIVHGAWCVGCCWALMAALFALGLMSLTWMILIAALIAIEKLLPSRVAANWTVTAVLLVVGVALLVGPSVVPGMPDGGGSNMQMQMTR